MLFIPKLKSPIHARNPRRAGRGFTLIEILIVVAIISILAAVAVVNFLEAQTRSKVSRIKAEFRDAAIGLEAFHVDKNRYPAFGLFELLSPVAYISDVPDDVFGAMELQTDPTYLPQDIRYGAMPPGTPVRYILGSVGPDKILDEYFLVGDALERDNAALQVYPGFSADLFFGDGVAYFTRGIRYVTYDPTNGTTSSGDIFRPSDHAFE